jgi:peptidoglycan L-alanyl-D-glutamate endopeptidase CwlK
MPYKLSKRSWNRLEGVHPKLLSLIELSIVESPYDFGIPMYGGVRSTEDQQQLYAKGRTKEGKIVTYADGVKKKSNHQAKDNGYGYAFDIFCYDENGKATWDSKYYKEVAEHILNIADALGYEVEWGGNWKFKDYPHFQLME